MVDMRLEFAEDVVTVFENPGTLLRTAGHEGSLGENIAKVRQAETARAEYATLVNTFNTLKESATSWAAAVQSLCEVVSSILTSTSMVVQSLIPTSSLTLGNENPGISGALQPWSAPTIPRLEIPVIGALYNSLLVEPASWLATGMNVDEELRALQQKSSELFNENTRLQTRISAMQSAKDYLLQIAGGSVNLYKTLGVMQFDDPLTASKPEELSTLNGKLKTFDGEISRLAPDVSMVCIKIAQLEQSGEPGSRPDKATPAWQGHVCEELRESSEVRQMRWNGSKIRNFVRKYYGLDKATLRTMLELPPLPPGVDFIRLGPSQEQVIRTNATSFLGLDGQRDSFEPDGGMGPEPDHS